MAGPHRAGFFILIDAALILSLSAVGFVRAAAVQERKPVPKDSVRVSVPGCAKGYAFTTVRRPAEEPGAAGLPEGVHLRMNGPKKLMGEIKAHQASMIEITGIMKKGDFSDGISLGGGVRISPGPPAGSSIGAVPVAGQGQVSIDIESWRQVPGDCPR